MDVVRSWEQLNGCSKELRDAWLQAQTDWLDALRAPDQANAFFDFEES